MKVKYCNLGIFSLESSCFNDSRYYIFGCNQTTPKTLFQIILIQKFNLHDENNREGSCEEPSVSPNSYRFPSAVPAHVPYH